MKIKKKTFLFFGGGVSAGVGSDQGVGCGRGEARFGVGG